MHYSFPFLSPIKELSFEGVFLVRLNNVGESGAVLNIGTFSRMLLSFFCILRSAWLNDAEDVLLGRISRKAASLSNLTLDTAEDFQVKRPDSVLLLDISLTAALQLLAKNNFNCVAV